jgi:hypothetical protein
MLPGHLAFEGLGFEHLGESCAGSYADVFYMEHDGQELAIKRMRSCTTVKARIVFQEVQFILYLL